MITIILIMQKVLPENRCFIDICVCSLGYVRRSPSPVPVPSETQKPASALRAFQE